MAESHREAMRRAGPPTLVVLHSNERVTMGKGKILRGKPSGRTQAPLIQGSVSSCYSMGLKLGEFDIYGILT